MSDSRTVLRLDLRPSWPLALLVCGLHLLAAASVVAVSATLPGVALAALLAGLGAATAWDRALLRGRRAPRAIEISSGGTLEIRFADGTRAAAGAGSRTVTRWLVAVPLTSGSRRSLLVAAGMLDADGFRRLRLWALWGRLPGVAPAQLPG